MPETRSWLDDLAAAEARGATGWAGINTYSIHCRCEVCTWHAAKYDLAEEK